MPTVLVTRPKHQQARFITLCKELGLDTHSLPLLKILPINVEDDLWLPHINDSSTAWVFTSRNAVEHCPFDTKPAGPVFAMGSSTAAALTSSGHQLAAIPEAPFNSEVLVEQLRNANTNSAVVVTGIGGRAYLGNELRSMQWVVTEIRCYERVAETHSEQIIKQSLQAADILSLTSIESMDALLGLAKSENTDWMTKPLVVNSERAAAAAKSAGFTGEIYTAIPAGDDGQIEAIKWFLQKKTESN